MNQNNQMILKENDVITGWLSDKDVNEAVFDNVTPINIYNEWCVKYDIDDTISALEQDTGDNFVERCLANWNMPAEYMDLDIVEYLVGKTDTQEQRVRVLTEIDLYQERGMIIVLKFLKYLVDICEENNIVLGVGRGSSVASYCLYLLGVHRIDSIKYDLDIKEFLK